MRIAIVGGGPAGLYFSLLVRKAIPDSEVVVIERNPAGATYGWGVVFSDRTLSSFREADYETYEQITDRFIIWDAIDIRYRDEIVRCGGQGFSGISRRALLALLQARCEELGVRLDFEREVTDPAELDDFDLIVGADGVRSTIRAAHEDVFRPTLVEGRARYIWFGTKRVFDSFTFAFRDSPHGFFQAHAYPFDGEMSTFIVECDGATWKAAGLDAASESESIDFCQELFAGDLKGHSLMSNASKWISFVTLRNRTWRHKNKVLVGDAAHTAHFSIGSGTKLAMEDSIALANALSTRGNVASALGEYELERKPRVERFQEAARQSQRYFENTARYRHMEPLQFAFHLLSRSGRIDYDDLRVRDRYFVGTVDRWFAANAGERGDALTPPPAFTPLRASRLDLPNRVATAPPPSYDARAGTPAPGRLEAAARTGAGLVYSGTIAVSEHARITPGCSGLYRDEHVDAWRGEIERARASTGAAFVATLGHSGPRGSTHDRARYTDVALDEKSGWTPIAASPQIYSSRSAPAVELDEGRMNDVIEDFVDAAGRARAAGFDVLEIHMGHGYLLGTFISPLTNKRADRFGGDGDARLTFPMMVFDAVRAEWPHDMALGVALSAGDWARGGVKLGDAVAAAATLKDRGCDFIRVLAGQTTADHMPQLDPYHLTHYADRVRNDAGIATVATGDITTVDDVNTIVAGGRADICLLRN